MDDEGTQPHTHTHLVGEASCNHFTYIHTHSHIGWMEECSNNLTDIYNVVSFSFSLNERLQ